MTAYLPRCGASEAMAGAERPPVNARSNTDRFAPVKAKRVRFTISRGQIVFKGGEFLGQRGAGRFVEGHKFDAAQWRAERS